MLNNKKIRIFVLIFIWLAPLVIFAEGLVPCGTGTQDDCTYRDLFVLANNIIKFLTLTLAVPLATATIAWAGITIALNPDNPGKRKEALDMFKYAILGFILAFGSYIIVETIIKALGRDWIKIL